MNLRKDNSVLVLLGAGASREAGIPTSAEMIDKVEHLLRDNSAWQGYRSLYYFVKSAIYFSDGLEGKFNEDVYYNVERLVNTLSELDKKARHPLYPFIGNWNIKLAELGGNDFQRIGELRQMIIKALQGDWVLLEDYSKSEYYRGLYGFAKDFQFPLRVFSLNYDLCMEKNCKTEILERGFSDERKWSWRNFELPEDEAPNIYLYKLHGSIDWLRDKQKNLIFSDEPSKISIDHLEIIFGTDYKLQYTDPFLFLAYQFRRWTLEAKLIITVGYGYGDEHINGILGQAMASESDPNERKLLAVGTFLNENEGEAKSRLAKLLDIQEAQVVAQKKHASEFMCNEMRIDKLSAHFPETGDIFEELIDVPPMSKIT
jgi:hypothetical protein